jgi:hypothetical protein
MAETKRMTAEQVVGYLLEGEGLDFPPRDEKSARPLYEPSHGRRSPGGLMAAGIRTLAAGSKSRLIVGSLGRSLSPPVSRCRTPVQPGSSRRGQLRRVVACWKHDSGSACGWSTTSF